MHLVALHGYPLDHRMWDPLAERAASGRLGPVTSVFAPDLRGRGRSAHPAAPLHAMSLFADDVAKDIESALPGDAPFLLAGLSMGGYVCFEFLKRHGLRLKSRICGLALFDTKASADDDTGRAGRKAAIEAIRKDGIEAALSAMLPKLFARRSKGTPAEDLARRMILATPPATAMADLAGLAVRDEGFAALSAWDRPLLVAVGDEDAIAPPSDAEAMTAVAARAPWVKLLTVPNAGHMLPLEQPDESAAGLAALAEAALGA
jgi:pimeloyl-ACP methyl ester carboxylesterase